MKFTIPANELLRALQAVRPALGASSILPILQYALIIAGPDYLTVGATSLDSFATSEVPCEVAEEGEHCLLASFLIDLLESLRATVTTIEVTDEKAVLRAGKSQYTIPSMGSEGFPVVPTCGENAFSLDSSILSEFLRLTSIATNPKAYEPMRAAIQVKCKDQRFSFAATDTHTLATVATELEESINWPDFEVPIQPNELRAFLSAIGDNAPVCFSMGFGESSSEGKANINRIQLQSGVTSYVLRLIDGTFPNFQKVIPAVYSREYLLDRAALLDALKRVNLVAKADNDRRIQIVIEKDLLVVSSRNSGGEAYEEVPLDKEYEKITLHANNQQVINVLSTLNEGKVRLLLTSNDYSPLYFKLVGSDHFLYICMPLTPPAK